MERLCLRVANCFIGRADKNSVMILCRNNHYHSQHKGNINFVRNINNQLKRPEEFLGTMNPDGKPLSEITIDKLGFNFKYHQHLHNQRWAGVSFFVYEQGYLPLEKEYYMLLPTPIFR